MDASDIEEALLGEDLARRLQAAMAVEEHIPLMRIAQAHEIGGEKGGRRQLAGPVEREGVHRLEHAVFHTVNKLEVADHLLGGKRLELQLAARLLLDGAAPLLEGGEADAGRPG